MVNLNDRKNGETLVNLRDRNKLVKISFKQAGAPTASHRLVQGWTSGSYIQVQVTDIQVNIHLNIQVPLLIYRWGYLWSNSKHWIIRWSQTCAFSSRFIQCVIILCLEMDTKNEASSRRRIRTLSPSNREFCNFFVCVQAHLIFLKAALVIYQLRN